MTQKKFTDRWIKRIKEDKLQKFPDSYIKSFDCFEIAFPQKTLLLGSELFGSYEILDINKTVVYTAHSLTEAKYILYANRWLPAKLAIPNDEIDLQNTVKEYEKHLDSIIRECEKDFKFDFPDSDRFSEVSRTIFSSLNIRRY
jgi:hypothetical protein